MNYFYFFSFLFFNIVAQATQTYSHKETSWADWREGTFENVVFEDKWRTLALGPVCTKKIGIEDPEIDQIQVLEKDSLIIATDGDNGAKLRRIYSDGSHVVLQERPRGSTFTFVLASDKQHVYFASRATSQIFQIGLEAQSIPILVATLSCASIEKLVASPTGALYALSEGPAAIFKVNLDSGEKLIEPLITFSDVPRIKELTFSADAKTLYAAADNRGRLYEIKGQAKKLLLQLKDEEITGLSVVNRDIYFTTIANIGDHSPSSPSELMNAAKTQTKPTSALQLSFADSRKTLDPSLLGRCYRMSPNGIPECLLTIKDEGITMITPHPSDGVLLGLSHSGKIIHLKSNRHWNLLSQLPNGKFISAILSNADNSFIIATSSPGFIYHLSNQLAGKACFISNSFDAEQIVRFGQFRPLGFSAEFLNKNTILSVRTGNCEDPDDTWNSWQEISWGEPVDIEPGQFIQYKIEWSDKHLRFNGLQFYYTDVQNLPPTILHAQVHMADFDVQGQDPSAGSVFNFPDLLTKTTLTPSPAPFYSLAFRKLPKKGWISCIWYAEDPNQDELVYTLLMKKLDRSTETVTIVRDIPHPMHSFETNIFADGYYQFQITASDEPENGQNHYTSSYETEPFVIDNHPPVIEIENPMTGSETTIKVTARDAISPIIKASYVLDQGEMHPLLPNSGIWDSPVADFLIALKNLSPGDHTIQLIVEDAQAYKAVVAKTFTLTAR